MPRRRVLPERNRRDHDHQQDGADQAGHQHGAHVLAAGAGARLGRRFHDAVVVAFQHE